MRNAEVITDEGKTYKLAPATNNTSVADIATMSFMQIVKALQAWSNLFHGSDHQDEADNSYFFVQEPEMGLISIKFEYGATDNDFTLEITRYPEATEAYELKLEQNASEWYFPKV